MRKWEHNEQKQQWELRDGDEVLSVITDEVLHSIPPVIRERFRKQYQTPLPKEVFGGSDSV